MNAHFVLSKKDLGGTVTEHQLLETQVSSPKIEKQSSQNFTRNRKVIKS